MAITLSGCAEHAEENLPRGSADGSAQASFSGVDGKDHSPLTPIDEPSWDLALAPSLKSPASAEAAPEQNDAEGKSVHAGVQRLLNFEGIGHLRQISSHYASSGVSFESNFRVADDAAFPGRLGHVNNPSPTAIAYWSDFGSSFINRIEGMSGAIHFHYSSNSEAAERPTARVEVWSSLNGTGLLLASQALPDTQLPREGPDYYVWTPVTLPFIGRAQSVRFTGRAPYVGIDDFRFTEFDPCDVTARIELSEVRGLRSPTVGLVSQQTDATGDGRLFLDTLDDGAIQGNVDRQRVRISVQVSTDPGVNPNCFAVRWELRDPDDPAGHLDVDPNGPAGGDNTGTAHEGAAHWFTQADHPISGAINRGAVDETTVIGQADSALTGSGGMLSSSVFFNATDDAGDNFRIRASLLRASNAGVEAISQSESGLMTTWRRRAVQPFWMSKPDDDQQVYAVGAAPGAGQIIVQPGNNGESDTLVLAGDDRRQFQAINAGINGIAETTANSGTFSPLLTVGLLRQRYSLAPADHLAYIDWQLLPSIADQAYIPTLFASDFGSYMDTQTSFIHRVNGTISVLGVNFIQDPAIGMSEIALGVATPPTALSRWEPFSRLSRLVDLSALRKQISTRSVTR